MFVLLPTATSWVSNPIYEMTRVALLETPANWNIPSKSVVVPISVPFTKTVAPGSGAPLSASVTVPLTCWANATVEVSIATNMLRNSLFMFKLICSKLHE
ncbi:MAG: Uncharacterised protein [Bacteroidota bacterium]|nr:MAG: Uncharacterised protein [Bacteroidota bacterium]